MGSLIRLCSKALDNSSTFQMGGLQASLPPADDHVTPSFLWPMLQEICGSQIQTQCGHAAHTAGDMLPQSGIRAWIRRTTNRACGSIFAEDETTPSSFTPLPPSKWDGICRWMAFPKSLRPIKFGGLAGRVNFDAVTKRSARPARSQLSELLMGRPMAEGASRWGVFASACWPQAGFVVFRIAEFPDCEAMFESPAGGGACRMSLNLRAAISEASPHELCEILLAA